MNSFRADPAQDAATLVALAVLFLGLFALLLACCVVDTVARRTVDEARRQGDHDEVVRRADRVARWWPVRQSKETMFAIRHARGSANLQRGRVRDAIVDLEHCRAVTTGTPQLPSFLASRFQSALIVRTRLAAARLRAGQPRHARACVQEAIDLCPTSDRAHRVRLVASLATIDVELGDLAEARRLREEAAEEAQALEAAGDLSSAHAALGEIAAAAEEWAEARRLFLLALEATPPLGTPDEDVRSAAVLAHRATIRNRATSMRGVARAAAELGDLEAAWRWWGTASEVLDRAELPGHVGHELRGVLGEARLERRSGRPDRARALAGQVVADASDDEVQLRWEANVELARAARDLGDPTTATVRYDELIREADERGSAGEAARLRRERDALGD